MKAYMMNCHVNNKLAFLLNSVDDECGGKVLNNVDPLQQDDERKFTDAITFMRRLYAKPELTTDQKRIIFEDRIQRENENLHAFATDIKYLAKQAFPQEAQRDINRTIIKQFMSGLRNAETSSNIVSRLNVNDLGDVVLNDVVQEAI